MYHLLIKLMLGTALMKFGINYFEAINCSSRECRAKIERASHEVLNIDWKPISVWPEEAKRFR